MICLVDCVTENIIMFSPPQLSHTLGWLLSIFLGSWLSGLFMPVKMQLTTLLSVRSRFNVKGKCHSKTRFLKYIIKSNETVLVYSYLRRFSTQFCCVMTMCKIQAFLPPHSLSSNFHISESVSQLTHIPPHQL